MGSWDHRVRLSGRVRGWLGGAIVVACKEKSYSTFIWVLSSSMVDGGRRKWARAKAKHSQVCIRLSYWPTLAIVFVQRDMEIRVSWSLHFGTTSFFSNILSYASTSPSPFLKETCFICLQCGCDKNWRLATTSWIRKERSLWSFAYDS